MGRPLGSGAVDLTGRTFGLWVVVERRGHDAQGWRWLCRCVCGEERAVSGGRLTAGRSKSCGACPEAKLAHGVAIAAGRAVHGHKRRGGESRTYRSWRAIARRIDQPAAKGYANYGGRGIKLCDRWRGPDGFANFLADMGERPEGDYTLDRIDVDGDYTPANCRWATRAQQAANTRRAKRVADPV